MAPNNNFQTYRIRHPQPSDLEPTDYFPDPECFGRGVFYHGTSNLSEERIEAEGFVPKLSEDLAGDLQRVTRVYEQMDWYGDNFGGYAVLKPFSLGHDCREQIAPVYFAESPFRAHLYATQDFAGGEKTRALHFSLEDLNLYLTSSEVRARHQEMLRNEFESLLSVGAPAGPVPHPIDLKWLAEEVRGLLPLAVRCAASRSGYSYGIIYAVRFEESDLSTLSYDKAMGLKLWKSISPSRIVGKCLIPKGTVFSNHRTDEMRLERLLEDPLLKQLADLHQNAKRLSGSVGKP